MLNIFNHVEYIQPMNSMELKRWLAKQGCSFETHKGGSGHLTVRLGDKKSQLPVHGAGKELGTGLIQSIKVDCASNEARSTLRRPPPSTSYMVLIPSRSSTHSGTPS